MRKLATWIIVFGLIGVVVANTALKDLEMLLLLVVVGVSWGAFLIWYVEPEVQQWDDLGMDAIHDSPAHKIIFIIFGKIVISMAAFIAIGYYVGQIAGVGK